jgi:FMN-dependent NADH-azoreductase
VRARQPDFLTPYLKAILGTIGLHDLTFFSMEGSALGPDAVAEARPRQIQSTKLRQPAILDDDRQVAFR